MILMRMIEAIQKLIEEHEELDDMLEKLSLNANHLIKSIIFFLNRTVYIQSCIICCMRSSSQKTTKTTTACEGAINVIEGNFFNVS